MNATDLVDRTQLRDDIPDFAPGDTLKVHVRVVEGNRERVQVFQGIVIRRKGDGSRETFTVRKVSFGVGVERTFPVHSPVVARIERVTRGDVRRATSRSPPRTIAAATTRSTSCPPAVETRRPGQAGTYLPRQATVRRVAERAATGAP